MSGKGAITIALSSKQVIEFLNNHPIRNHNGDFGSLLETHHYIYTTENPVDNDTIRSLFRHIEDILSPLPTEQSETLFWTVSELCTQYECSTFSHGILVGMHLMTELNALP